VNERPAAILEVIRALPEQTLTATLRSPRGSSTRTFKGALLSDYARAMGLIPKPPSIGFANYYFVATAEDGFRISLAYFEVTPRATEKRVLLAYEQDGEPLRVGVRLVVPGDDLGGRSIMGVAEVELRSVPSVAAQEHRPESEAVVLSGLFQRPVRLSVDDLARFPNLEVETLPTPRHGGVTVQPRRYQGALLWDVIEQAGPLVDENINEDILRKLIVARSTDGCGAVIAPGEVDPRFMAGDVLIATACEGRPLGQDEGRFRLIVPYDKAVGRMLKSLQSIELVQAYAQSDS
jgi:DMSO/TMAO reductase YedYZ molybdopterin-dependent catalytic subunit